MTYLDSNILVYATLLHSEKRHSRSRKLLEDLIESESLVLSPLVIQEYFFIAAKFKVDVPLMQESFKFFLPFVKGVVDSPVLERAENLCHHVASYRNFNDAVHVTLAETFASRLVTLDKHFLSFQSHSRIPLEVLQS